MTLREFVQHADSDYCACHQPKRRGEAQCDACYYQRYIETKQPSAQVACERLDQWEERT